MPDDAPPTVEVTVLRHREAAEASAERLADRVVVEEPMEIRLEFGPLEARLAKSVSITMRTPGEDFELARGLLFSEGIIERLEDVQAVERCGPPAAGRSESNVVKVSLSPEAEVDPIRLQRNLISSSACGVCGKASLEAVVPAEPIGPVPVGPRLSAAEVKGWSERLRAGQAAFASTGGVHAAGVFEPTGELIVLREDVGRHNAVDKVVGTLLQRGELPVGERCLVVSGRTSFEILQKAIRAGFPVVAGVGAPSNLAVELARRFGLTLLGFLRADGFNVYAGEERVE